MNNSIIRLRVLIKEAAMLNSYIYANLKHIHSVSFFIIEKPESVNLSVLKSRLLRRTDTGGTFHKIPPHPLHDMFMQPLPQKPYIIIYS